MEVFDLEEQKSCFEGQSLQPIKYVGLGANVHIVVN